MLFEKRTMVRSFLRKGGREFQVADSENARLTLYRSMRGRGGIKLFEPSLHDMVKSERMYSGVSPLHTLNTITALLYFVVSLTGEV